jgi:hypothetical protein
MLDKQQATTPRALDDLEQLIHRGNFFELFLDEPLEGILREGIAFLLRQRQYGFDGVSDLQLMIECELHRFRSGFEPALGRGNRRKFEANARVENIFDEAMRVVALFRGLLGEVDVESGQPFEFEPRRDGFVLQRSEEFHADLRIERGGDFFRDERRHSDGEYERCRTVPASHSFAAATAGLEPRLVPLTFFARRKPANC